MCVTCVCVPRYVLPNVVCNVLRYVFPWRLKSDQKEKVPTPVLHRLYVGASICTLISLNFVFHPKLCYIENLLQQILTQ